MQKIQKKLTKEQRERDIIFSSSLSTDRNDGDTIHEITRGQEDGNETRDRLLNDKFFNNSPFNYNIIRT